ncbi:hypothetical protein D3C80_1162160 [compost metagenome]
MRFIIVFNNDFAVVNGLASRGADGIVVIAIVMFTHTYVGEHMINIGDRHRISVNISSDDIADLTQGFCVDMPKKRQRFIGNIQRKFCLARCAGFLFTFDALHQQNDKSNTHTAQNHRNTDFRDNIQSKLGRRCPGNHQDHGQRFAHHARYNTGFPVLFFGKLTVNPAGKDTRDNAGDKAWNCRYAADIDEIAVRPRNNAGNNPHPWAE